MIQIKVAQLGQRVATLSVEDGSTVEIALEQAGITAGSGQLRVGGAAATPQTPLEDGAVVTVVPQIRGGCELA